jgi:hypothetical protein
MPPLLFASAIFLTQNIPYTKVSLPAKFLLSFKDLVQVPFLKVFWNPAGNYLFMPVCSLRRMNKAVIRPQQTLKLWRVCQSGYRWEALGRWNVTMRNVKP